MALNESTDDQTLAVKTLTEICGDTVQDPSIRIQAAQALLHRPDPEDS